VESRKPGIPAFARFNLPARKDLKAGSQKSVAGVNRLAQEFGRALSRRTQLLEMMGTTVLM
jgi:hypothetical protein